MSIELYPHNESAYKTAVQMLEKTGKAAIIHPTGTGKSFIAFKLAEECAGARILWLAPSAYIFHTQKENYEKASGQKEIPENITFCTYARLMRNEAAMEEAVMEVAGRPDYIILDEFHRCGAAEWGKSVRKLIHACPEAKLLGLSATSVRYLDNQRDMAAELFEDCVASRMSLGEAIVRQILPAPVYVVSMYSYGKELKRLEQRVEAVKNAEAGKRSRELLEKLRRSLEQADGPEQIFAGHMKKDGKYLVFCADKEHMDEMLELSHDWFGRVDGQPHIYRAYYESPDSHTEFQQFCGDKSSHLKLLYCIDMLNEGVHVPDVDGVVLLRPTVSPIIYLQQVGRALSVTGDRKPVIFDIVNNFDSLYCIDALQEELEEAFCMVPEGTGRLFTDRFVITDTLRDCREIFAELQKSLNTSWDIWFQEAEKYYHSYGNLKVPKGYVTADGLALGSWIQTQRKVYVGKAAGVLTAEQTAKLDRIGMIWENVTDYAWLQCYDALRAYFEEFHSADVPSRYRTGDGLALGRWVFRQRQLWLEDALEEDKVKLLDRLSFVWDKKDFSWKLYYAAAKAYYNANGHLDVPVDYCTPEGLALGRWLSAKRSGRASLSQEKQDALTAIGICWDTRYDGKWEEKYRLAEAYYREHGNLNVPVKYTVNGVKLGKWLSSMRMAGRESGSTNYQLTEERVRRLSAIGMIWDSSWEVRFRLAEGFYREHGHLRIPQTYVTADHVWLGKWLAEQRRKYRGSNGRKKLTDSQIRKLNLIGMDWETADY